MSISEHDNDSVHEDCTMSFPIPTADGDARNVSENHLKLSASTSFSSYEQGYDLLVRKIIADDAENMVKILTENGDIFKTFILSRGISDDSKDSIYENQGGNKFWSTSNPELICLSVQNPVSLSVVYQSAECFRALAEHGADLHVTEMHGNNIVHLLIYAHKLKPSEKILEIYDMILEFFDNAESRGNLMLQRNYEGYTPLDLAVIKGCKELFTAILYTDGVYREIVEQKGKLVTNRFEFVYKSTRALNNSFLWQMTSLADKAETTKMINSFSKIPVIRELAKRKFLKCIPMVLVWTFFRFMFLVGVLIVDRQQLDLYRTQICDYKSKKWFEETWASEVKAQNEGNSSEIELLASADKHWEQFLQFFTSGSIVFLGMAMLIFDGLEALYLIKSSQKNVFVIICDVLSANFRTSRVVNEVFHRTVALLFSLECVFSGSIVNATNITGLFTIGGMAHYVLIFFNILPFVQILPVLGSFAIGFRKMLAALSKFMVLQLAVMYVFLQLFRRVQMFLCQPTTAECGNSFMTIYSMFLIMLNMFQPIEEGHRCAPNGLAALQVLHALYAFIVPVMIINYLIAVMSSVYNDFAEQQAASVFLHRLHISLVIERRIRMATGLLMKICRKLQWCKGLTKTVKDTIEITELDVDCGLKNLTLPRTAEKEGLAGPPETPIMASKEIVFTYE